MTGRRTPSGPTTDHEGHAEHAADPDCIVLRWPSGAEMPGALLGAAELEVLVAILNGASDREIATARGTSVRTVAAQTRTIYAKLGISGRRAVLAFFRGDADSAR